MNLDFKDMEKSESIINLTKALAKFHSTVGKISKDAKNPFFKSNYASLSHILQEIQDPLEVSGLVISQFPNGDGLTTILIHCESGEYLQATYTMPVAKQNDPQALGSAISYARRYAVSSILSLKIDDDDAEKATDRKKSNEPNSTTSTPQDDRPWLNKGKQLDEAMAYLRTPNGKLETIEKKYKLSKEIRQSLQTVIDGL
jgi:hypothetical protein